MPRCLSRNDLIASHYTLTGAGPLEPPRFSFEERVAAAARAGFPAIGIEASSYAQARKDGLSDRDVRALLAEHDIVVAEIGVTAPLSVEILSTEHRALPVDEAARRAYESTRAIVQAARDQKEQR